MIQKCTALEAMKREILENGISALKAKGIEVRLMSISAAARTATVAVNIVDDKKVPLVEIAKCELSIDSSLIVLELDEAFYFSLE